MLRTSISSLASYGFTPCDVHPFDARMTLIHVPTTLWIIHPFALKEIYNPIFSWNSNLRLYLYLYWNFIIVTCYAQMRLWPTMTNRPPTSFKEDKKYKDQFYFIFSL
jgi:hypothetical protein